MSKVTNATVIEASVTPSSELIDRSLGDLQAVSIQQTMRGCLQEACGCEAQSEYKVYGEHVAKGQKRADTVPQQGHLLEESSCLMRFCCGQSRSFRMPYSLGTPVKEGVYGPKMLEFRKPLSLPLCFTFYIPTQGGIETVQCPCCCFLPSLETFDNENNKIGSTRYLCDGCLFVPKFTVHNSAGDKLYLLKPDVCCGGCCISPVWRCGCCPDCSGLIYLPFFIRNPESGDKIASSVQLETEAGMQTMAQVTKVWSGFKKEMCSDADNFQVLFPSGIDPNTKASLVGATVLVDFTWFETNK